MKYRSLFLAAAALIATVSIKAADAIPASRLVDWTPGTAVGVRGGIPTDRTTLIDVTKSPYNADNTGASDCTSAIGAAIDAAKGSGKVVYLPAGTYTVNGTIYKGGGNFTIRGDGDSTVIKPVGASVLFTLGSSADWDFGNGVAITNGLSAGSSVLTVASTANFTVGQLVRIDQLDDHNFPIVSIKDPTTTRSRAQIATITSVNPSANTITISRGLLWKMDPALAPKVSTTAYGLFATGIGIENLKIDAIGSTAGFSIWIQDATNSWVKNVHVINSYSYSLYLLNTCNMEVRHCTFEQLNHAGPNGSLVIVEQTGNSLFEDNIFYKASTHMEFNYGCSGNVFAYNFMEDSTIVDTVGISIDTNHGPHNGFNLYEGNISPKLECDGYFGSTSDDVVYRNWFHGTSPGAYNQHPILLKRFTRNYSVVGNLLGRPGQTYSSIYTIGTPNIGNDGSSGTASLMNGTPWADWSALLAGTYTGWIAGFQEIDLDVKATLILQGNWNVADNGIPANEALGSVTLPDSRYRSSKPAWFGSLTWPAFDPTRPNTSYDAIPAGYRFVHGTDPDTSSASTPTPPPPTAPVQTPIGVRIAPAR